MKPHSDHSDLTYWDRRNSRLRRFLRRMIGFPALANGTPLPCSKCGAMELGHDCDNGMQMEVSWWG